MKTENNEARASAATQAASEPDAWRYKTHTSKKWLVSDMPPEQASEWNEIVESQPLYAAPVVPPVALPALTDSKGKIMEEQDHTGLLALWNHSCGSGQHLWHGPTLAEAAAVWRELNAKGEEAELTAWGRGIIATHDEMRWKFGEPKGTFACPICGQETPHQHSAEVVAFNRDNEAHRQRCMERRWEEISARIASITGKQA